MIVDYKRHTVVMRLTDTDTFSGAVLSELPQILQCDIVYYIPSKLNRVKNKRKKIRQ